jgi:GntR family transcriptional regulator
MLAEGARGPGSGPAVEDARHRLLDLISSGTLRPGDRLGTERELATRLSVSRATLRQVLAVLAEGGIVRRVPGRAGGTFVAQAKVDRDLSVIVGLPEYLRRQGFVAGTQVLSATMSGADDIAAGHLAVPAGSLLLDIVRIRLADGIPISLERVQLPAEIFPGLLELPLGGSLYDLLDAHYGIRPDEVVEHLEVTEAGSDEAVLLGVNVRAAPVRHAHRRHRRWLAVRVLPRPVPGRPDPRDVPDQGQASRDPPARSHGGPGRPAIFRELTSAVSVWRGSDVRQGGADDSTQRARR